MGKISQADAQSAACKITEPINKKMTEVEEQIRVKVTEYVTDTVPVDVMKVFKGSNCEYITTKTAVNLHEHGFTGRSVSLMNPLPIISHNTYSNPKFNLNKTQAAVIQKLVEKKEELTEKYKTTKSEVENSILSLGSHKRVLDEFPEAYGYLPGIKANTGLMVQLQPVRAKVLCLTSVDEEKKCIEQL